jgi:hypothetical protein
MKYLKITPETDTKITGSPNGIIFIYEKLNIPKKTLLLY